MQAPAGGIPTSPTIVTGSQVAQSPTAVWRAFQAQRNELTGQLRELEDKRRWLSQQVTQTPSGASKSGLEARIAELDKRIASVDKQVADAEANISKSAAVPGAVVERPPPIYHGPPEEAWVLGGIFLVVCILPLSFAMARRIWRRGAAVVTSFPRELSERLDRLDQAVDAIGLEVERIGEGQRFVTRVMSEGGKAIGSGAGEPVEVPARAPAGARLGERGSI